MDGHCGIGNYILSGELGEISRAQSPVKEFARILKTVKGTGNEYKEFTAGAIAGVRMAWNLNAEKKVG